MEDSHLHLGTICTILHYLMSYSVPCMIAVMIGRMSRLGDIPVGAKLHSAHSMSPGFLGELTLAFVVSKESQATHADASSHMRQEGLGVQSNGLQSAECK